VRNLELHPDKVSKMGRFPPGPSAGFPTAGGLSGRAPDNARARVQMRRYTEHDWAADGERTFQRGEKFSASLGACPAPSDAWPCRHTTLPTRAARAMRDICLTAELSAQAQPEQRSSDRAGDDSSWGRDGKAVLLLAPDHASSRMAIASRPASRCDRRPISRA
jgi:hypothetical protein